jgi:tetratricopeptide (TPR) repeat protein
MNALVSGQAGLGALVSERSAYVYRLDSNEGGEIQLSALTGLFRNCTDIVTVDCRSNDELHIEVEQCWSRDRCLHLILMLLDQDEDRPVRCESAECVDALIDERRTLEYVANRLYSHTLDGIVDWQDTLSCIRAEALPRLSAFLGTLRDRQQIIAERLAAFDAIPISVFGNPERRERFRIDAIEAGAFRLFVESERGNLALLQMLVHPRFRGNAVARDALQAWAAPFREAVTNTNFEVVADESSQALPRRGERTESRHAVFERVQRQKDAIKRLIRQGNESRALEYAEQLILAQKRESEPVHLAKSLCDLASFSKGLGATSLQLEFAKRAVREVPEDGWSHQQLGDAYLCVGEYEFAMRAFEAAGRLGDERSALIGRAEAFRTVGHIAEALAAFDACISRYPTDKVARNGKAAALADFGRFSESLELYDELCAEIPMDSVSFGGRAETLRAMGRLEESLSQLDFVISSFPDEHVPMCAKGEVLREMRRLSEARDWFSEVSGRFPLNPVAKNGEARVLREMGLLEDARQMYQRISGEFPLDPSAKVGLAEVEKTAGALVNAETMYRNLRDRFPRSESVRNGLASILAALAKYPEAEALLPHHPPASRSEWHAFFIRGLIAMRSDDIRRAESILRRGVVETPWISQRSFFRTALASLELRRSKHSEALDLLSVAVVPAAEPLADLIRMHAYGALRQSEGVRDLFARSAASALTPAVRNLRDQLAIRYQRADLAIGVLRDEATIFQFECDALLLAA